MNARTLSTQATYDDASLELRTQMVRHAVRHYQYADGPCDDYQPDRSEIEPVCGRCAHQAKEHRPNAHRGSGGTAA